jgi:two-component system, OmpR family, copper resistance phosphate regulon response regulator CusR
MKILFVEDDPTTRELMEKGLCRRGYVVDMAEDGEEGLRRALSSQYDLAILDVMLPGHDGFWVVSEMRRAGLKTPVLFLSARAEVSDRVHGLDLGADDYLAKPFAFAELVSRVRAIGRRRLEEPPDRTLRVADLTLDLDRMVVHRGGCRIELAPKQLALLEFMMRNHGCVLSRSMILEKVWGWGFETRSNPIDVQVTWLRRKIDRDFEPKLLHTARGLGYVLEDRSG